MDVLEAAEDVVEVGARARADELGAQPRGGGRRPPSRRGGRRCRSACGHSRHGSTRGSAPHAVIDHRVGVDGRRDACTRARRSRSPSPSVQVSRKNTSTCTDVGRRATRRGDGCAACAYAGSGSNAIPAAADRRVVDVGRRRGPEQHRRSALLEVGEQRAAASATRRRCRPAAERHLASCSRGPRTRVEVGVALVGGDRHRHARHERGAGHVVEQEVGERPALGAASAGRAPCGTHRPRARRRMRRARRPPASIVSSRDEHALRVVGDEVRLGLGDHGGGRRRARSRGRGPSRAGAADPASRRVAPT